MDDLPARHERFLELLKEELVGSELRDLSPTLDWMRMIKSEREVALIRASSRLVGLAMMEVLRATEPGITEYEVEALARYVFWRHGAQGSAYYALAPIGPCWWPSSILRSRARSASPTNG